MIENKKVLVTGGAGFIGSHLVDSLSEKNEVVVVDNLSSGRREFLNDRANFIEKDLSNLEDVKAHFSDVDFVFHLAANPDVREGLLNPEVLLKQNIILTFNVLEAMRENSIKRMVFTSSSTVYGEAQMPTSEEHPCLPISLYGASKLSCEALISSYCHSFEMQSHILRLANIVGERSTHGVILDFIEKLRKKPEELEILGNGSQKKSYLHISDCIDATFFSLEKSKGKVNIFNIGSKDTITVERIGKIVSEEMNLNPKFKFTGGKRGWRGDVPKMLLNLEKIEKLGWNPRYSSEESVREAVRGCLGKV
ncbi:MAG: NAD-dependent epimerase/dehydratase family protein [Candidatus Methanofastidiosia archaeon]